MPLGLGDLGARLARGYTPWMAGIHRCIQEAIDVASRLSLRDPGRLAWALASVLDPSVWEVRSSAWGVAIYPVPQPDEGLE